MRTSRACVALALACTLVGVVPASAEPPTPTPTMAPDTLPPLPDPVRSDTPKKTDKLSDFDDSACQRWTPDGSETPERPWHLERLHAKEAWKIATGKGVTVAVIDTGVAVSGSAHTPPESFASLNVLPPQNEQNGPDCTHGTFVAGLVAARPAGEITDFAGIAPDANVIGIRALYGNQAQEIDGVVEAIYKAIELKVDIINISQASAENRAEYADAVQSAIDHGIVVVAAAGNADAMPLVPYSFPASYPDVISVGMSTGSDTAHPNSLKAPGRVSVAAPGAGITSIAPSKSGQVYLTMDNGTSFAAPLVSGVAALMIQQAHDRGETLSPAQVKARLEQTADPPAGPVPDAQLGYGIVNPVRALSDLTPAPTGSATPASPTPIEPIDEVELRSRVPLYVALTMGGIAIGGSLLGLLAYFAIPAARKRRETQGEIGE